MKTAKLGQVEMKFASQAAKRLALRKLQDVFPGQGKLICPQTCLPRG
jgi:hypothetical protein